MFSNFKIRRDALDIFIVSFFILALELSLIRQMPALIQPLSYFTNLVLMACFSGLGIGCILWRSKASLHFLVPLGILLLFVFIQMFKGVRLYDVESDVHFWMENAPRDKDKTLAIPLLALALISFVITSLPFIGLGQLLIQKMHKLPRLKAYAWDIMGSIVGVSATVCLSAFSLAPWILICLATILFSTLILEKLKLKLFGLVAALSFLSFAQINGNSLWSPYYFIEFQKQASGLSMDVNSNFHQYAINFENNHAQTNSLINKFSFPYKVFQLKNKRAAKKILILGGGSGNDAAIAKMNGAEEITVVEIDPKIVEIGRKHNPSAPYRDDPNVKIIINDARNFVWNSREKFDLIILGTLDSQVLLSGHANLRLDNYVYTAEHFAKLKQRLKADGFLAAYYSIPIIRAKGESHWLYARIYKTISAGFGESVKLINFKSKTLFNLIVLASASETADFKTEQNFARGQIPATDNWPFLYIKEKMLPHIYQNFILLVFFISALIFWLLFRSKTKNHLRSLPYFCLGVGFTLVESAAIVRLALVFGSVWQVNAVVFISVLLVIFLGNLFVMKVKVKSILPYWIAIIFFLIFNGLINLSHSLELSLFAKIAISFVFAGTPIFFASICFSKLFEQEEFPGLALGANVLGAMLGGSLEYFSMLWGMQSIWFIAAGIYALALLFCSRRLALSTLAPTP